MKIQVTDTYVLHFTYFDHPDGTRTVRVESQWTGAKDPDGLQTKWQATLGKDEWADVATFLLEGQR